MIIELNDVTVELTDSFLNTIRKYTQGRDDNESGGIILGGFIPSENKYVFTDASVPNCKDRSGPLFFIRNSRRAQKIINKQWKKSKGTINYLGEWHTHGWVKPYPSSTDKELLKLIIADKSNVWNEVFMLILGNDNSFYLGMTDIENKGIIVAEQMIKGE